ncbi:asparagine synthetase B [Salmonella enterica subsp. enterica]|uniref:Asparagine synthetase B n=1 Tax=Salmonella enterica I TaxID=59201 RepID=A0A379WXB6_SALET|nr:asparagine synthetase B [Salmonella enterica subsp. enterica]
MFAFALYDSEKDAYLIGRDHIGIIPLYMGYDEFGNFYVASEMKALTPVCRTIKEFPAGSYLWSKDGEIRQYYQRDWFDYDAVKDNVTDKNALRQALEESVKSHLMSDVPYGVLLSGVWTRRLSRQSPKNSPPVASKIRSAPKPGGHSCTLLRSVWKVRLT